MTATSREILGEVYELRSSSAFIKVNSKAWSDICSSNQDLPIVFNTDKGLLTGKIERVVGDRGDSHMFVDVYRGGPSTEQLALKQLRQQGKPSAAAKIIADSLPKPKKKPMPIMLQWIFEGCKYQEKAPHCYDLHLTFDDRRAQIFCRHHKISVNKYKGINVRVTFYKVNDKGQIERDLIREEDRLFDTYNEASDFIDKQKARIEKMVRNSFRRKCREYYK